MSVSYRAKIMSETDGTVEENATQPKFPRVSIQYCTQCRNHESWMLRAAYFAQELLTTFASSIGEVALIPTTGGKFAVSLSYESVSDEGQSATLQNVLIWDRKAEGGFPETKVLKQRIRDCIEPAKDLGHSDTPASIPGSMSH